jgi:hypothetical protein
MLPSFGDNLRGRFEVALTLLTDAGALPTSLPLQYMHQTRILG